MTKPASRTFATTKSVADAHHEKLSPESTESALFGDRYSIWLLATSR
jgi:hypothetical protein